MTYPLIIQGGMGAGVSHWYLANQVSRLGQLGVVSGTALDEILARRLQDGDPGGHMRRALDHFPFPAMAERIWQRFYLPGGRNGAPYQRQKMHTVEGPREVQELLIVSNFVEVWLAREGHSNPVGINYLEKIQMPHLASMFGSMLAGVEYVLMGAGIPIRVPGVLDRLSRLEEAEYHIHVVGSREQETIMRFNPKDYIEGDFNQSLPRPKFLAIISSNTLAQTLLKKANGKVDGFIIEGPTAGGHNAPPRGKLQLSESGEPIYGERDVVDLPKMRELGAPFWLAGGVGSAHAVKQALADGAVGVQVGTAFAFCTDSGLREDYRAALVGKSIAGTAKVFTDPLASPTGFPFKVAVLDGTFSQKEVYEARPRICDLGYLREAYEKEDKTIGYRCPSEPVTIFVSKGGAIEETAGRKCVCNGLLANIGMQQTRPGNREEVGIITTGDDLTEVAKFLRPGQTGYSAADVIDQLLSEVRSAVATTDKKEETIPVTA